ncbi:MAG: UDP-N-acetylmuramate--L-alanine ligase [Flavobacteriales bacterium]
MMGLSEYKNIYFIGIGGIGMSALSRYFNAKKINIYGYDKVKSSLCSDLEKEGMEIHYSDSVENISVNIKENKQESLVVYTAAIPSENKELSYFKENGFEVLKRSEVLGKITEDNFSIAVAGTHGKTTTSTMIAHVLHNSDVDCTAFLGGISSNYNSNLVLGSVKSIIVVEADEFDRSFLTLSPDVAIITSVDADHLDIYKTKENLLSAFTDFTNKIKTGGTLYLEANIDSTFVVRDDITILKYSSNLTSDCTALNISSFTNNMLFDVEINNELISQFKLNMGGEYNVSNALVSIAVAKQLGVNNICLLDGMSSFKGIKRRFETHILSEKIIYIDDYAHHPKEITETIQAVKKMYPNKKITVLFQPHLYSRTNDFMNEFAVALSLCNHLILLDIYAAREQPINGVSSEVLAEKCNVNKIQLCSLNDVVKLLEGEEVELLLTLGAGDIGTIVGDIKTLLL